MKFQIARNKHQRSTKTTAMSRFRTFIGDWRFFGVWVLVLGVFGCRSSKPPPERPVAVARAERSMAQARGLSEQENWPAAASEWRKAAQEASLLNDGAGE